MGKNMDTHLGLVLISHHKIIHLTFLLATKMKIGGGIGGEAGKKKKTIRKFNLPGDLASLHCFLCDAQRWDININYGFLGQGVNFFIF